MITAECLEVAKFKRDPFTLVPLDAAEIWIKREGMLATGSKVDLREYLYKLSNGPLFGGGSGVTEFISVCGDWGAGKSHTLLHIASLIRQRLPESIVVYLKTVRVADKTRFIDLYSEIIQNIGKSKFISISERLNEAFSKMVNERVAQMTSEEIAAHVEEAPRTVKGRELLRELTEDESEKRMLVVLLMMKDDPDKMFGWLKGGKGFPISYHGEDVDLPNLTSDYEAGKAMKDMIKLCTSIKDEKGKPIVGGFVIMIDQWDRVLEVPATFVSVVNGISVLLRDTPQGLALLTSAQGEVADVLGAHGETLQTLFTSPVVLLDSLNENQAREFLIGLFRSYRKDHKNIPPDHPFEPEALLELVRRTDPKLPRRLIANTRKVFDYACREGILSTRRISVDDVQEQLI